MKKLFFTLLLINLSSLFTICSSYAFLYPDGYYISGLGAITLHRDTEFNVVAQPSPHVNVDYKLGYGVGGAIGTIMCRNWRLEVEGYFRNNEAKRLILNTNDGSLLPPAEGTVYGVHFHERSFSLMANAFYDYCPCECVKLFIGGGVGVAWVQWNLQGGGLPQNPKAHYYRFAFQGITGIAYQLCANLWATADYRLWGRLKKQNMHPFSDGDLTRIALSDGNVPLISSLELGLRLVF